MGSRASNTDSKNFKDLYPHSLVIDVYIRPITGKDPVTGRLGATIDYAQNPYFFLGRVYRQGKSPESQRNGLQIIGLPWGEYEIILDPLPHLGESWIMGEESGYNLGSATYSGTEFLKKRLEKYEWQGIEADSGDRFAIGHPRLFDNGNNPRIFWLFENETYSYINTGWDWFGSEVEIHLGVEGGTIADPIQVSEDLDVDLLKRSMSTESTPYITVTTVSEIVDLELIGLEQEDTIEIQSVKGISLVGIKVKASERMQQAPQPNFLITEGKKIRNHWATGIAGVGSSSTTLYDPDADFLTDVNSTETLYVRNISKSVESEVNSYSTTNVSSSNSLDWEEGDLYLVYSIESSSYFPDVFCDLLTAVEGGVGSYIDPDEMIDYYSIVAARKFVVENELFYDEAITERISWAQWATKNAIGSLLYPARISGKLGLKPEDSTTPPVGVFNDSNIIKDSYKESYVPWYDQDVNKVTMNYLDGRYKRFNPATLLIMTDIAYLDTGTVITEESLDLPSITHEKQAVRVGGLYIKSRLLQHRNINFATSPHGLFVNPGDLIIVQNKVTEYDSEINGYVYQANSYSGANQQIRLSRKTPLTFTEDYTLSVWHKTTGNIEYELPFTAFTNPDDEGNIWVNVGNLTEEIVVGDYIAIGLDVMEDSLYRVSQVSFSDDGQIKIDATLWDARVVDDSDLLYSAIRKTIVWVTEGVDSDNWNELISQGFSPLTDYVFPF